MGILFTLFFLSLGGIVFMVGRKLLAFNDIQNQSAEERVMIGVPGLEEIRSITTKRIKRYGYVALVITLRTYIRSSKFLEKKGREITRVIRRNLSRGGEIDDKFEQQEVSKFLRMISDYKQKVGKIKRRIKAEEDGRTFSESKPE